MTSPLSDIAKMSPEQLKEYGDRIPDDQWELEADDGAKRTYIHWLDREEGICIRKEENLIEDALFRANDASLFESQNQRFGDGKVVGRIPLNVYMREFAPRLQQGDEDFAKWFLNNPDNKHFRTFRGKV